MEGKTTNIRLNLAHYMSIHGVTYADIARVTGIKAQNVKKTIENNPKATTIQAIADGLGIDPRDFYFEHDAAGFPITPSSETTAPEKENAKPADLFCQDEQTQEGTEGAQIGFFMLQGKGFKIVPVE